MTRVIYKYILSGDLIVELPEGYIIRKVGMQNGNICMWCEVDPTAPKIKEQFEVYGTGHPIKWDMGIDREYLDSVFDDVFVWHIYKRI